MHRPAPRPFTAAPLRWLGLGLAFACATSPLSAQGPGRRPGGGGGRPSDAPAAPGAPSAPVAPPVVPEVPDADKLLDQLDKFEDALNKARTAANAAAVTALREVAGNEQKAVVLWLECIHDLEFRAKEKKEADFRQWRDGPGKRFTEGAGPTAVRLNLQYLALTIRAAEAKTDGERNEVLGSLMGYLDELVRSWKDLREARGLADGSVLSSPVARRYKLENSARPKMPWSLNPMNVSDIYESGILPPLRQKKDLAKLQSAWTRRAQHEATLAAAEGDGGGKAYNEHTKPRLEWSMARDLFLAGSPDGAGRLLRIIQSNGTHPDATGWVGELRSLLTAAKTAAKEAAATAAATTADATPATPTAATETPAMPAAESSPLSEGTLPPESDTTPPEPPSTPAPEAPAPASPSTPTPGGVKFPTLPRR